MFLVNIFFRKDDALKPEDLAIVMSYHKRMHRDHIHVDSHAGPVRTMMFISQTPGKYIGTGECVAVTTV